MTDPDDMEGQLVDEDSQIAEMARRTAKVLAKGERVFVPVVVRAIRQRCGLTQREAGLLFGTGEKSFEKYESGEIQPSVPTKRLLKLAMERPELFQRPEGGQMEAGLDDNGAFVREALRAAHAGRLYAPLFEGVCPFVYGPAPRRRSMLLRETRIAAYAHVRYIVLQHSNGRRIWPQPR